MAARWDLTSYIAKLPDMPLAELCARLRGEYAGATYGKHPLHAEAARRLEAMQAEIERLKRMEDYARGQGAQLPGSTGGLFG